MQAYISSPGDALILLRGLEQKARGMIDYSTSLNGVSVISSAEKPLLRLMKVVDGQPTCMTISRYNKQTLVASLENKEALVNGTAKRRLAALLIPLVSEYVRTDGVEATTDDRVRIVFDQNSAKDRGGKKCILFAQEAANQFSSGDKRNTKTSARIR